MTTPTAVQRDRLRTMIGQSVAAKSWAQEIGGDDLKMVKSGPKVSSCQYL